MHFPTDPIGLPGLIVLAIGGIAFIGAVFAARGSRPAGNEEGATRSLRSLGGVMLQGLGIGIAGFGPQRIGLDPASPKAIGEAVAVALLMAGAVTLFMWSSRTMGRNWSIVARTRADHELVQGGPFAWIRHPIYTGMALFMIALAIAFGHSRNLVIAAPIFAFGTWRRVRIEETMLRNLFGAGYDAYAGRVKRFVPGLF